MNQTCSNCGKGVAEKQADRTKKAWGFFLCSKCQTLVEQIGSIGIDGKIPESQEETEQTVEQVEDAVNMNYSNTTEDECTSVVSLPAITECGIVRPAIGAMEAVLAWKEFRALRTAILDKSDFQRIGNDDFIKKSGWRKFATFYNLTDKIVEETQVFTEGMNYYWKIKVECVAPNGRVVEGVGICATTERKFAHIEHDVYTTAHTRAKNRAISDMVAAGEVSAEEVSQ